MTTRIAINGFGRIGRCVLRALYENGYREDLQVVAINELADIESLSYMLRYDSTHGRFYGPVTIADPQHLLVNGDKIRVRHQHDPSNLDWAELGVDLVLECSGQIRSREDAELHLERGAGKVLISNPADSAVDNTIIFGLNHDLITPADRIVSNGSCSTNALIPILTLLDEAFGIQAGVTTTIHSAMNDQPVIDAYHSDLRRTRSAVQSIIPVDTGLSLGIERLMPQLAGKIECLHLRVPTVNVSALDISLQLNKKTSSQAVNELLQSAAEGEFAAIMGLTREAHASIDFNHDPRSAIVDATQTRVSGGHLLKLLVWFDNEWGFANRMLDTAMCLR
ncbi:MAG: glyceraldehyde 3-phosphate dehydrogenase NAD-binding domain-containing protein [Thalassolituus sp.]|jgi:D-erythrose 4-phosphate dehydrogenase|uniref:Glyceraldehyde 3-phosphate dehydrogenase n=2 Tax=root TaxID=1 RepID=M5E8G7_9GAMM|nr:glyceraldehyde 3-phosphate dehydrogenase NAD-binding domain-containing protein [Thalassolituus oleivorans]AHK16824.1 glyceraldehyde-3-phosphate dehydrogenase [Thalassolituus oleivorans R6-15]APR68367.1 aldehyde dehydrogenase [Thalassolituus oleivorans]MBQ0726810.1 aldehyde dehydrogenase [Thalassolituus oleivorans]MBQ0781445.1 aldehyde dehydrogenase [Thalassolituus oleivorans]MDF1641128.1 glyceraldehyde 3-phosphate dehydrogenase NAD-binding domain-containing protein [Thalassolituus oleivoran